MKSIEKRIERLEKTSLPKTRKMPLSYTWEEYVFFYTLGRSDPDTMPKFLQAEYHRLPEGAKRKQAESPPESAQQSDGSTNESPND
jgi:hypothetical protein